MDTVIQVVGVALYLSSAVFVGLRLGMCAPVFDTKKCEAFNSGVTPLPTDDGSK